MIPKIIHYCWFGGGKKSELMEKCMASWKKYFPDYEIIEWNESNFDVMQNDYCREAYENKKWAFVSDYARLAIICQQGGIYFDTDVEVLKNFEYLLDDYGYLCFEADDGAGKRKVATGLGFAAEAGNPAIGAMLKDYENIHFINDGEMDLTTCPDRNTDALIRIGLVPNGEEQVVSGVKVYPPEFFCGYDVINFHPDITEKTCTVHHYAATWAPAEMQKHVQKIRFWQGLLGYKNYDRLKAILKRK